MFVVRRRHDDCNLFVALGSIPRHKAPIVEPQNKLEFTAAMCEFYDKVKDPKLTGAVFFAVCRGKVSEGLDFADHNGRAVIITGMP